MEYESEGQEKHPTRLKWIDGKEFFDPLQKSIRILAICFAPAIFPLMLGFLPFFLPHDPWNIVSQLCLGCFMIFLSVVMIFGFYSDVWAPFLELKKRRKVERFFIQCPWCRSDYTQEIWKSIARTLEDQGEDIVIKVQNLSSTSLCHKLDVVLKTRRIRISFYRPFYFFDKKKRSTVWLGLGLLEGGDRKFLKQLKRDIKELLEGLAEENPFCSQCKGGGADICYGGWHQNTSRNFDYTLAVNLFRLEPFYSEKILKFLVKQKEELADKWVGTEEKERYAKMARKTESFDIRFREKEYLED